MARPRRPPLLIAFGSRFGTTRRIAESLALGVESRGGAPHMQDLEQDDAAPRGRVVVVSAIIWETPLRGVARWMATHRALLAEQLVAAGVVCGRAGVEPGGGVGYARALARRVGRRPVLEFSLSGALPGREQLTFFESTALAGASTFLGKSFTALRADYEGAFVVGQKIGELLVAEPLEEANANTGESR